MKSNRILALATMEAKTVQGQNLNLVVSDKGVMVDNGVIHVIDTVIMPKV